MTNPFAKSRKIEKPYATFTGYGPFGQTVLHVLKTYQTPENEKKNQYARWFVAVKTDMTYGSFDMGDSYIKEAIMGLWLDVCSKEFAAAYPEYINSATKIED